MDVVEKAKQFIDSHFPDCESALLAGSFVRNESTSTSDFDIVIIQPDGSQCYRETFLFNEQLIEAFVHTKESCLEWFQKDLKRGKPSLQNMVIEGIELKNHSILISVKKSQQVIIISELKKIAVEQLEAGPNPLSNDEIDNRRYFITDMLDDLIGSIDKDEWKFISNELVLPVISLDLLMNNKWLVNGKRIASVYRVFDASRYSELMQAISALHCDLNKTSFINWVESILNKYGGRLDAGYTRGKI